MRSSSASSFVDNLYSDAMVHMHLCPPGFLAQQVHDLCHNLDRWGCAFIDVRYQTPQLC